MNRILLALASSLVVGCESNEANDDETTAPETTAAAPDNTKINERDRNAATLTPQDQGQSEADVGITQRIRQAIVGADSLTMNEKNVKVITVDGVVTLRGPVETEQSKAAIASIAKEAAGVKSVDNQLEVTGTASASAEQPDDAKDNP